MFLDDVAIFSAPWTPAVAAAGILLLQQAFILTLALMSKRLVLLREFLIFLFSHL